MNQLKIEHQTLIQNIDGTALLSQIEALSHEVSALSQKVVPPPKTELVTITWTMDFLRSVSPNGLRLDQERNPDGV